MSRGLGKVEKKILSILNTHNISAADDLCYYVFDLVDCEGNCFFNKKPTAAQRKSIYRVIKNLEKKGLIVTCYIPMESSYIKNFQKVYMFCEHLFVFRNIEEMKKFLEMRDPSHAKNRSRRIIYTRREQIQIPV